MINFYVVGTKYLDPAAILLAETSEVGDVLILKPEPDNKYDVLAVAVYKDNVKIGYVPNRGVSCSHCHKAIERACEVCPDCYIGEAVNYGLAGRLIKSGAMEGEECFAYISGINPENKDRYIRCTLSAL